MAVPTFFAKGAKADATNSAFAVPLPAGTLTDKFLLLVIETNGGGAEADPDNPSAPQTLSVDPGYTLLGSNVSQATALADQTRLTVYWKRGTSSETQPTVAAPGAANHGLAFIVAYSGVDWINGPIHKTAWGNTSTNDTTVNQIPAVTTTFIDCLIINVTSAGDDSTFSSPTNASLTGVAIDGQELTTAGVDGAIAVISGGLATPGNSGATTATISTSEEEANLTFGLAGPQPLNPLEATVEAQSVFGGRRDSLGGFLGRGPTLSGPQQDTKLVQVFPGVKIRVDFAPDTPGPLQDPTWTSMSTDVITVGWSFGRNVGRDQPGPAQLNLRLENTNGKWDSGQLSAEFFATRSGRYVWNSTAGVWETQYKGGSAAGQEQRMDVGKQIRVQAVKDGTTHDLYRGVISGIRQTFPGAPNVSQVETEISAQDHMSQLALYTTTSTFAREKIQTRISNMLTEAGWLDNSLWRYSSTSGLDRGLTVTTSTLRYMRPLEGNETNILQEIRNAAASDIGIFLLRTDGRATYHGEARSTDAGLTASTEYGYRFRAFPFRTNIYMTPTSTQAGYNDLSWVRGDSALYTEAVIIPASTVNTTGGQMFTRKGALLSERYYGLKTYTLADSRNDAEARNVRAQSRYASGLAATRDHVVNARIHRDNTHWLDDYLPLQQDDSVYIETPQFWGTPTGSSEPLWEDWVDQLFVNRAEHQVDVRTQTWGIQLSLGERGIP